MADNTKIVVLVADDEPSTLALLSRHLRSKGYSVLEASDGDQAWELAHEHLPHLVLLDVMMPGMSGWEVCRKIREAVSLAHTGVIMLTGIGERLNEMTSPLYGADAHIDKPFEFSDLDEKIRDTLERRRAGAMGRPDHADEQDGSVAVQPEPMPAPAPRAKPPVKAKPTAAAAAPKAVKKVRAVDPDETLASVDDIVTPAKLKKKAAKKAPPKAKEKAAKKAPAKKAPPAKKKAPAKKAAAKKAPAKAAKKAAKKAPVAKKKAAAKKAPAKPAKKAGKKASAAKKAPAPAAKPSKKKAAKKKAPRR